VRELFRSSLRKEHYGTQEKGQQEIEAGKEAAGSEGLANQSASRDDKSLGRRKQMALVP